MNSLYLIIFPGLPEQNNLKYPMKTKTTQCSNMRFARRFQLQPPRPTIAVFLDQYRAALVGQMAKSFEVVRLALLAFLGPIANRDISFLSSGMLQQFVCHLLIQHTAGTVLKKMAFIQKALEKAVAQGWLVANPMHQVQLPAYRPEHPVRPLADDAIKCIYGAAHDDEWRCVIVLGFYGLLSFPEMAIAQTQDVDLLKGKLSLQTRRTGWPVDLAAPACSFLRNYLQQVGANGPLLPRLSTFSRRRFNAGFRRLLMRAGIPARDIRFASLRLSALVYLSHAGVSGNVIRSVVGHTSARSVLSWHVTPAPRVNLSCLPDVTRCQHRSEQDVPSVPSDLSYEI
jgi:hypothetical protein